MSEVCEKEEAVSFDLLDQRNLRNPYPMFKKYLREGSIHFDAPRRQWVVSSHSDLEFLLKDRRMSADRYTFAQYRLNMARAVSFTGLLAS